MVESVTCITLCGLSLLTGAIMGRTLERRRLTTLRPLRDSSIPPLAQEHRLVDLVELALDQSQQTGRPVSLMMIEVDELDHWHQRLGAMVGDVALRAVFQIIRATTRSDFDHVVRCDRSLVGVLLPDTELDAAVKSGERLRRAIAACRLRVEGEEIVISANVGIAVSQRDSTVLSLLENSEMALERARESRPDGLAYFDGQATLNVPWEGATGHTLVPQVA